jgi:hypothetical protein
MIQLRIRSAMLLLRQRIRMAFKDAVHDAMRFLFGKPCADCQKRLLPSEMRRQEMTNRTTVLLCFSCWLNLHYPGLAERIQRRKL